MMQSWRLLAATATLSIVALLPARIVHAQSECNPGIGNAFLAHQATYTTLANALGPQLGNFDTKLQAMVDQATYASLLADAHTLANSITNGRVLITVPDGTVVLDTSKPDDPTNTLPAGNSFQHFKNKTVNENHNSRIAIHDAQEWPCGAGLETKFSTTDNTRETYLAIRLGTHLDSDGTIRVSVKQ